MIVGLTSGIGCGKSTVAKFFREWGVSVIDSDQITRQLVALEQPALKAIVQHFGIDILQHDGTLNRIRLRSIIFESLHDRQWLENLLHPLVKEEILKQCALIPLGNYAIVEVPLLIEANFQTIVDRVLVVDCLAEIQIARVSKRDATPPDVIQAIINSQVTRIERLAQANEVIENNGTLEELKHRVEKLHHYYIKLSK
jgi:dephospho-CoA kinase